MKGHTIWLRTRKIFLVNKLNTKFCLAHLDFLKRRNIKFNKMCVITACFRIKHVEHTNILTFHVKDKFNKKWRLNVANIHRSYADFYRGRVKTVVFTYFHTNYILYIALKMWYNYGPQGPCWLGLTFKTQDLIKIPFV